MSDFKFDIKEIMSQSGQDNAVKREIQKFVPEGLNAFETSASRDGTSLSLGTFSTAATLMGVPQYNSGKDALGFQEKVFSWATQAGLAEVSDKENKGHLPTTGGVINPIDYLVPADIRMNTQRLLNAPWDGKEESKSDTDPPADPTLTPNPTPNPTPSPGHVPGDPFPGEPSNWDYQKIKQTILNMPSFVMAQKNARDHRLYDAIVSDQFKAPFLRSLCLVFSKFILWGLGDVISIRQKISGNSWSNHSYGSACDFMAISYVDKPNEVHSFGRSGDLKGQCMFDFYTFVGSFTGYYRFAEIGMTGKGWSKPHWTPEEFNRPINKHFYYDGNPGHLHLGMDYDGNPRNPSEVHWVPTR